MSELELVWRPLQIGPMAIDHRIVVSPHGAAYGGHNIPTPQHIAFYSERARGGAALVGIGATAFHRRGDIDPRSPRVASNPASAPMYADLAESIHRHGAKVVVELAEGGVHDSSRPGIAPWTPPFGPTDLPSVVRGEAAIAMDAAVMRELREDARAAAALMADAGIDGITLHAAHSYLFGQFLSPAYNDRTDSYGGSVANRCRFIVEVAEAIREAAGPGVALGIRLSYDEYVDGGITPDLSDEYVAHLDALRLFDLFDISAGGYHSLERATPPMALPDAHIAAHSRRAKQIVRDGVRVLVAGRITRLAMAEQLLREGSADLVAMTRSHIADPHLVNKARRGEADTITPCVGSNECVYNLHIGLGIACTVNPHAGRELQWTDDSLVPASTPRRIVVVGAGPAGLKVAETAARRGHEVTVIERAAQPGGGLRQMADLPNRSRWLLLADHLASTVDRLGVRLALGQEADAEGILSRNPDAVVVAVGADWDESGRTPGRPERTAIPGLATSSSCPLDTAIVRTVGDPSALGRRVVIVDETGYHAPLGLAQMLAANGTEVHIVSRHYFVGHEVRESHELALLMQTLVHLPITMVPQTTVDRVEGPTVVLRRNWGAPTTELHDVDTIVFSGIRHARRRLFDELNGRVGELHRIGDALAPRKPADAIYDGERLGRVL